MIEELGIDPDRKKIVLIAGATASGKSGLALKIAKKHDGIIINADSLQVYECWRILTSRPSLEDEKMVPHLLYGHISCHQPYSVSQWLDEVVQILEAYKDKLKIIVGGTGLYFSSLTSGFTKIPEIKQETKVLAQKILKGDGIDRMLLELSKNDASTFENLDRDNPRRVQRAWEVFNSTGVGLSTWFTLNNEALVRLEETKPVVLNVSKHKLENNISERLDQMIRLGVLEECKSNIPLLNLNNSAAKTIGAKELVDHLKGNSTLEEAKYLTMVATRQYAKRQRTWFRNKMKDWEWFNLN